MTSSRCCLSVLTILALVHGLTATALAQLQVDVFTAEPVTAQVTLRGVRQSQTLPAGRDVTASMDVYAGFNAPPEALSQSRLTATGDRFDWTFRNWADAGLPFGSGATARAEGTLRLRATWQGGGALIARVRVTVSATSLRDPVWVDVGDDGVAEASNFIPAYEEVVQIDSSGLPIRAHGAAGANLYSTEATITVELRPVVIVEVTEPCGPNLSGSLRAGGSHGLLDLFVTGSPPGTWGVFFIGRSLTNYPLPGTDCVLSVVPVNVVLVPVSPTGTVTILGTELPAVLGTGTYFQYLAEDRSTSATDWYASQTLHVTAL